VLSLLVVPAATEVHSNQALKRIYDKATSARIWLDPFNASSPVQDQHHHVFLHSLRTVSLAHGNWRSSLTSAKHMEIVPPGSMPKIEHEKEPGNGYSPGSPLYAKQQAQSTSGKVAASKGYILGGVLLQIFLLILCAALYRACKRQDDMETKTRPWKGQDFTYPLCACNFAEDWGICLMSLCCPLIRWADTISAEQVQLLPFWAAVFLVIGLYVVIFLISMYIIGLEWAILFDLVLIVLGVHYRQKLRLHFGHDPYTASTMCQDCLIWCFCTCCAVVQEAREVEKCKALYGHAFDHGLPMPGSPMPGSG